MRLLIKLFLMMSSVNCKLPNILILVADDLGYGDVSYVSPGRGQTPHLDALASSANSVRFDRFYSTSNICSPTRMSIMTGRMPKRDCLYRLDNKSTRMNKRSKSRNTLGSLSKSLPQLVQEASNNSYTTFFAGKWHLGGINSAETYYTEFISNPGTIGFDEWYTTSQGGFTSNIDCACYEDDKVCTNLYGGHYAAFGYRREQKWLRKINKYYCTEIYQGNASLPLNPRLIRMPKGDDSAATFLTNKFLNFVTANADTKPFLAVISFYTPHIPFVGPELWKQKCIAGEICPAGLRTSVFSEFQKIDYWSSIAAMDNEIGRIRQLLSNLSIDDNTMIWFVSDNGPEKNTPGFTNGLKGQKHFLYEGGHRVPGILHWPSLNRTNIQTSFPATTVDIVPTCLGAIQGNAVDVEFDGINLLPEILGDKKLRSKPIVLQGGYSGSRSLAVVDNGWKYNGKTREYFDLEGDPFETTNQKRGPSYLRTYLLNIASSVVADYKRNCPKVTRAPTSYPTRR